MSAQLKKAQRLARELFKVSLVDGAVSSERVAGVLAYLEQHQPPHLMAVLKTYRQLVAQAVAQREAVVEHAGPIGPAALQQIAAVMTQRYHRPITPVARPQPALLAGLRVRVGDDVYDSSVAGQLAALATRS